MSDESPARTRPYVHLLVGTPCFGGLVTDRFALSLLALQGACLRRSIGLSFCLLHDDALITRARNAVVAEFLYRSHATHLLFIDADIGFDAEQVFRLVEADKDVAGGAYPIKKLNWPNIRRSVEAGEADIPAGSLEYVVDYLDPARIVPENGFARVRHLGTGFMLIRRPVFERMAAHYPKIRFRRNHSAADDNLQDEALYAFFDCMIDPATGYYLSEDFTFCKRWLDMGGELWVDLSSRLTHVGRLAYEGNLMSSLDPGRPDRPEPAAG